MMALSPELPWTTEQKPRVENGRALSGGEGKLGDHGATI